MNDMMTGFAPVPGDGQSPSPLFPPPPSIEFSAPCHLVIGALANAMLEVTPPVRTKHVEVHSRRTGRTYSYDYAPLETILAAVTKPLAKQGLVLTQIIKGTTAVTILLLHRSGQWMSTDVPLMKREEGYPFQDFSGALTASRRVGIQALLSISAEDDDDGNRNAGNEIHDRHFDPEVEAELQQTPSIILIARSATGQSHGSDILDAWRGRHADLMALRRADRAQWEVLVGEVAAGLKRALGSTVAAAWKAAAIAETPEQHAAIRAKWDGEWADTLEKFRAAVPYAFGELMRFLNLRRTEIETAARTAAPTEPTLTSREAALAAQQVEGEGFSRLLLDAQGNEASGEFTSPEWWAKAYAELRARTPLAEREALDQHNMEAISEAAAASIGADIVLREAMELDTVQADMDRAQAALTAPEPEPQADIPVVDVPMTRAGTVDVAAYLAALYAVIEALRSAGDIQAFEDRNGPVYTGPGMPMVVLSRVLKSLASRKRALGIPLPADA